MPTEEQTEDVRNEANDNERLFTEENKATVDPDEKLLAHLQEKFSFEYGYKELKRVPAKISVSRLSPDVLDENDTSVDLINDKKTAVPDFFREGVKKSKKALDK